MSDQLTIVDVPATPKLTDRQQRALTAIEHAGEDGLLTEEVGAVLHARKGRHGEDEICAWCGRDGRAVAEELKRKGRVAQRARPTRWVVAGTPRRAKGYVSTWVDDQEIPF